MAPTPQRRAAGRGIRRVEQMDRFWPAQLAVLAAIAVAVVLPSKLTLGPPWLLPALEGVLLIGLAAGTPSQSFRHSVHRQRLAIGLIALVSAANLFSLALLIHFLLHGGKAGGHTLVVSGAGLWITNVLVFAIWFWEVDRGGPVERELRTPALPDFQFPQMAEPALAPKGWMPDFVDYLYVAFTNATAFSPTDAMPMTRRMKLLMAGQALISLVTVALVIARAVNILA
jgi:uncharacterized membrane protein